MPDSVLIPAPVKATIWRAARARRTSSATGSEGARGGPGFIVLLKRVTILVVDPRRAKRSRGGLCPYTGDGTMRLLEPSSNPANAFVVTFRPRAGMDACGRHVRLTGRASVKGLAMIISQPAWICIESTWQRLIRRESREDVSRSQASAPGEPVIAPDRPAPGHPGAAVVAATVTEPRPEPAAPAAIGPADPQAPLTPDERRARAAALRALALSRGRRFDAAKRAFIKASQLDPLLDLTRVPTFWSLERAAHEAAIDAYVETGRDGDAAILRARVRSTYRPKAVRPRPGPVLSS